jgi:D-alanine-D-alanine ligase
MKSLSVCVLAGGRSSEREVSLASGASAVEGLRQAGHRPQLIEISQLGEWSIEGAAVELSPGRGIAGFDVAFPVVHGPFGEDGTLQGLLESLAIPYVGSGVYASALCIDKILAKQRLAQVGIAQVDHVGFDAAQWSRDRAGVLSQLEQLGLPLWVKPARLGSSVGISRVDSGEGVAEAVEIALTHDPRVIAEASCGGREIEVSVLERWGSDGPELVCSPPGEIVLPGASEGDWYDFERKYEQGGMELAVPADLDSDAVSIVHRTVVDAFRASDCSGYARVDTFVDGNTVLINEINTAPGFTATSVYSRLFAAAGTSYPELMDALVESALARHAALAEYRF